MPVSGVKLGSRGYAYVTLCSHPGADWPRARRLSRLSQEVRPESSAEVCAPLGRGRGEAEEGGPQGDTGCLPSQTCHSGNLKAMGFVVFFLPKSFYEDSV